MESSRAWPALTLSRLVPSTGAWIAAIAALLFGIAMVGWALAQGEIWRRQYGVRLLESSLERDDFIAVERIYLEQIGSQSALLSALTELYLDLFQVNGYRHLGRRRTSHQELALDISFSLATGRLGGAERSAEQLELLLDPAERVAILPVVDAVREAREIGTEISELENKTKVAEGQAVTLLQQYNLLQRDAAELLGLSGITPATSLEKASFYKDGVLANLPELGRLPDNILSLVELRAMLGPLGGAVTKDYTEFNDILGRLASSGMELSGQSAALLRELEQLRKSLLERNTALDQRIQRARSLTTQWLLQKT